MTTDYQPTTYAELGAALAEMIADLRADRPDLFWGNGKILISRLHAEVTDMSLADFKAHLLECNRKGYSIRLTRCDMVSLFPAAEIAASETRDGYGSEFHFVSL